MALATFAAGCFWGVEQLFGQVPGVTATRVGYTGGTLESPRYEDVCSDTTGHAEAVEIEFDPSQVSYEKLLDLFFHLHDPTQVNRQGPDSGSQYRSAIFYHDAEQQAAARAAVQGYQGRFRKKIATQIVPAARFWPAEEYHQKYFDKRGVAGCHVRWE
jgi:peptide-methionine (S)-S-oxide reductase